MFEDLMKEIALGAHDRPVKGGFVQVLGILDGEAVICRLRPEGAPAVPADLKALKSDDVPKGALVYGISPFFDVEANVEELCTILVQLGNVRRHVPIKDAPWNREEQDMTEEDL